MSDLEVFYNKLLSTGLPVAYEHFEVETVPPMPFICYAELSPNNFAADGRVYHSGTVVMASLFTVKKDKVSEDLVETAIDDYYWEKDPNYDEAELCTRVDYTCEI